MFSVKSSEIPLELIFPVCGSSLPIDHGYGLFAAISKITPEVHSIKQGIAIQTIAGQIDQNNKTIQIDKYSRLKFRIFSHFIPSVYQLSNKKIQIGSHEIRLGIPEIKLLAPAPDLYSRITIIKGHQNSISFLSAAQQQLDKLGIEGCIHLSTRADGSQRRKTLRIKQYTIVGYGLNVTGLSERDSLVLQSVGIGGKRKLGCGIFVGQSKLLPTQTYNYA